jgi:hypothetical protein
MRAIGLASVQDTDQLIGGHCQVKLITRKSEEYGDSNEIKAWKSAAGGSIPAPAAAPAAAAKPSGSAPPWAK